MNSRPSPVATLPILLSPILDRAALSIRQRDLTRHTNRVRRTTDSPHQELIPWNDESAMTYGESTPGHVHAGAVVASDTASADADRDNETVIYASARFRRRGGAAAHHLGTRLRESVRPAPTAFGWAHASGGNAERDVPRRGWGERQGGNGRSTLAARSLCGFSPPNPYRSAAKKDVSRWHYLSFRARHPSMAVFFRLR